MSKWFVCATNDLVVMISNDADYESKKKILTEWGVIDENGEIYAAFAEDGENRTFRRN